MATKKKSKGAQEVLENAPETAVPVAPVEPVAEDPDWVVNDPEFATEPASTPVSVDDVLAELGLVPADGAAVPEIELPERPAKQPKAKKEKAPKAPKEPKAKKEKEPKAPKAPRIPIDAPIPAVEFAGLTIGVYGNILEELEEPDANGYKYAEIKLERYNATAHETFRNQNGRMVLLYPQGGGTYLVAAQKPDGTIEPVIEVTNRGRGCLRCRQLATKLMLAFQEKKDEEMIDPAQYAELVKKINFIQNTYGNEPEPVGAQ